MTEQEATDILEDLVGSPNKCFRLMQIYEDCRMNARSTNEPGVPMSMRLRPMTKEEVAAKNFRVRAKNEGYTSEAIEHYLNHII